jgi:hypothetical protein
MAAARIGDSTRPAPRSHRQPIDAVTAADSVATLLGELKTDNLPREEQLAISRLQASAIALRLNWIAELCRVEFRDNHEVGDSASASSSASARDKNGPGKWWEWARASYVAAKARLGS